MAEEATAAFSTEATVATSAHVDEAFFLSALALALAFALARALFDLPVTLGAVC